MNRAFIKLILSICTGIILSGCTSTAEHHASGFKISAVQLYITEDTYKSERGFTEYVDQVIRKTAASFSPDLIIFPEYTSAFFALFDYSGIISTVSSFEEGIRKVHAQNPEITNLHDLFFHEAPAVEKRMERIWGGLAEKYQVYIVAGTYFHGGKERSGILTNRLAVYSPSGEKIYYQDKVYLTDFEKNDIGLSSGEQKACTGITIEGKDIVFTICRDSFFTSWDQQYKNADLWIGVKANGDDYNQNTKEDFTRAVPERVSETGVPYGLTVCLTGHILDLFWEGQSSAVLSRDGSFTYIKKAETYNQEEILKLIIPRSVSED